MTLTAGVNTSYLAQGNKEDFKDIIFDITPDETPLFSNVRKVQAKNKLHQWQTDALAAATINSQLEGDEYTVSTAPATTVLSNYTQISTKTYGVSGTQRAIESYGRSDQLMYDKLQRGLELRTDVEVVLATNQAKSAGSATAGRLSAGLPSWLTNYVGSSVTGVVNGDGSSIATAPTGNSTAITYELLASAMQLAFEDGGQPSILMLPPNVKRTFSNAAFSATPSVADIRYNINRSTPVTAVGTVEKYLSDFGEIDVVVNRQWKRQGASFLQRMAALIDPRYLEVAILRNFDDTPLAKTGDADRGFMTVEYTLAPTAPTAHAGLYGMT